MVPFGEVKRWRWKHGEEKKRVRGERRAEKKTKKKKSWRREKKDRTRAGVEAAPTLKVATHINQIK